MKEQRTLDVLVSLSRVPKRVLVAAVADATSRADALRRVADVAECLENTRPKTETQAVIYAWSHGVISDESAIDALAETEAGERWADIAMAWTPEERRAAVQLFEEHGYTRETLKRFA